METEIKKALGVQIQQRLAQVGRSKRWLAQAVGVSPASVTGWVQDGHITIENLCRVAGALGVSTQWLMGISVSGEHTQAHGQAAVYGSTAGVATEPTGHLDTGGPIAPEYWALKVAGVELDPRYRDGEVLLLDRIKPPVPGTDVLLYSKESGEARVRALVADTSDAVCTAHVCGGGWLWEPRTPQWSMAKIVGVYHARMV
ncbi:helix-turn-helix domain protein (plasmid) [Thioalkalivibrio sp. K90mix]|uniref:helix-turn-helix domain-containing protein n=1 Tax=Thioalkalivibrio sp. (strain K90mix) TaxID=396595 RepID=UPI000195A565|nr:helix-turn-helix transcriptional regulator [Thioalkalivibrio sp. K90mix]ADC73227.1 helix-turn-helix domain protein [Thioalkalivibrio sp. K90mix]